MASQETPNYRLSRWAGTDRILVEEFNDNWDKIDTALKGNADKAAALQTALASCGNCQIGISTYTGTGTRGEEYPTVITFPKMPTVFFVRGRGTFFAAQGGASEGSLIVYDSGSAQIQDALLSWSGNQLSIVSSNIFKVYLLPCQIHDLRSAQSLEPSQTKNSPFRAVRMPCENTLHGRRVRPFGCIRYHKNTSHRADVVKGCIFPV